jgi:hypothetical protein
MPKERRRMSRETVLTLIGLGVLIVFGTVATMVEFFG